MDLRARAGSAVPDDTPDFDGYAPTDDQRTRAAELHVDLDSALRKWRGTRKANGATPVDLVADFDAWLEREPQYAASSNGNGRHEEPDRGIVRRFEQAPAEPDEPPVTPEQRQAGRDLVRQAIADAERKALGARDPGPMPDETVDPVTTARRENERQRQRAAVSEKLEAESGQPTGGAAA